MTYSRVIIDMTKKYGCPDCKLFRHEHRDGKHWQTCKIHRKCVELQHLSHQEETDEQPMYLDPSAEDHHRRLAEIETEDGSFERELSKAAETRFDREYISQNILTDDYAIEKMAPVAKVITAPTYPQDILSELLPMCLKARAACEGRPPAAAL